MRVLDMLTRWLHPRRPTAAQPAPSVEEPATIDLGLPEPPAHDPRYHAIANELTAVKGRVWVERHQAYARAEARSIEGGGSVQ